MILNSNHTCQLRKNIEEYEYSIGVALITQYTHVRSKKVTLKGANRIW